MRWKLIINDRAVSQDLRSRRPNVRDRTGERDHGADADQRQTEVPDEEREPGTDEPDHGTGERDGDHGADRLDVGRSEVVLGAAHTRRWCPPVKPCAIAVRSQRRPYHSSVTGRSLGHDHCQDHWRTDRLRGEPTRCGHGAVSDPLRRAGRPARERRRRDRRRGRPRGPRAEERDPDAEAPHEGTRSSSAKPPTSAAGSRTR